MEAMDFLLGTEYNYTYIAIGLGMVISLFLTETLGVMAGGIIVPGYFALYLHNPIKIISKDNKGDPSRFSMVITLNVIAPNFSCR